MVSVLFVNGSLHARIVANNWVKNSCEMSFKLHHKCKSPRTENEKIEELLKFCTIKSQNLYNLIGYQ